MPTGSASVVHSALAETSVTAVQPVIAVPLDVKLTVPAAAEGETVAVSVTEAIEMDGFGLEVTLDVLANPVTPCSTALEVLPANVRDPPYTAVKVSVPALRPE